MRKTQKQQAEELVRQMEDAHNQIKKYIEQGDIPFAIELLEDCQNGGIALGTFIDETEGEGHPTVSLLEEYCELTYQIHEDLTNSNDKEINTNKLYKLLKQKLIKIANSLKNDIPIRKEAVFLPYKASMWDSLESIWEAANNDPNCDAYVIPIPYYDKNPDGSFREMHYEGDQYPKYVPITKYDEFDFEGHRPDMMYIHNPYDKINFVTSVHPFFYTENLKRFTEQLIYIPYFVLGEIEPDNMEAIDSIRHFCAVPAVFNADRVVVESEKMRQIYINVLTEMTGESSRGKWEKKILGLGSPKFDKVAKDSGKDLEIPAGWLEIIEKPDGGWKRVILYNTSIAAFLKYGEKMLEKMESIFRIFKENQDEVSLLWRPHPLMETTIESMRPQLLAAYEKLLRQYKEEGWGIYDDSADLNRAIALSDAYYGDPSSVVYLCERAGKPIMIQNAEV